VLVQVGALIMLQLIAGILLSFLPSLPRIVRSFDLGWSNFHSFPSTFLLPLFL